MDHESEAEQAAEGRTVLVLNESSMGGGSWTWTFILVRKESSWTLRAEISVGGWEEGDDELPKIEPIDDIESGIDLFEALQCQLWQALHPIEPFLMEEVAAKIAAFDPALASQFLQAPEELGEEVLTEAERRAIWERVSAPPITMRSWRGRGR